MSRAGWIMRYRRRHGWCLVRMRRFWQLFRFGLLSRSHCGLRRGFGRMIGAAFFRFCGRHGKPTRVTQESHSVAETEAIAAELARALGPGMAIALHGNLG